MLQCPAAWYDDLGQAILLKSKQIAGSSLPTWTNQSWNRSVPATTAIVALSSHTKTWFPDPKSSSWAAQGARRWRRRRRQRRSSLWRRFRPRRETETVSFTSYSLYNQVYIIKGGFQAKIANSLHLDKPKKPDRQSSTRSCTPKLRTASDASASSRSSAQPTSRTVWLHWHRRANYGRRWLRSSSRNCWRRWRIKSSTKRLLWAGARVGTMTMTICWIYKRIWTFFFLFQVFSFYSYHLNYEYLFLS